MDKVLGQLDKNRLVEIAKNVADIVSITGDEYNIAHYLGGEFERLGMTVKYQEVEEGRPNVIGTLKGSGGGPTLMFCAHMDHFDNPQETIVEGDRIYGRGLVNMKAAFPCYIVAVEMLQKAGVELKGDIIISGVVGEIEKAQVNRFSGKTYRGAGVGARYMMDHGVTADMCIIGEPTGLQLQIGNAGLIWAEVTVDGKAENFVIQAGKVAQAIQDWEKEYQQEYKHPFMLPTVQIGAIDGGNPFKPGTQPSVKLYIIVKTLPKVPTMAIQRALEKVCARVEEKEKDIKTKVELYLSTYGYEISKEEKVVKVMEQAHQTVFAKPVQYPMPKRYGITSDGSRINAYGVPAITYGPGFGTHLVDPTEPKIADWDNPSGIRRGVGITNMINCAKVYAMAAYEVCTKTRQELGLR
ncbi:MAG TPA: M20/M25/M40 family metallo-hydrolase [Verrucomicrobiae bacterium]|jgi:acetylornithine deacetylase/succinyl-diaminopimelate desuccinylase-like protein|nr:M20/M25/M40 family metallo-hydrolase [Verrucomicrobiae bacterium]